MVILKHKLGALYQTGLLLQIYLWNPTIIYYTIYNTVCTVIQQNS